MSDRTRPGHHVRSWLGDAHAWPDAPLEQGNVRISGTALDVGASWYVTTDRLGWTTVVLLDDQARGDVGDLRPILRDAARRSADPIVTALALQDALGERARSVGLAIARVGPYGSLVELLNVSLPTVLVWDPIEGLSPYEPLVNSLAELRAGESDIVRLHAGGAVTLTTSGVLPANASWKELRGFVRALGIDPLGGTVAEAPPVELGRLLRGSWGGEDGPRAVVVVGLPSAQMQVA